MCWQGGGAAADAASSFQTRIKLSDMQQDPEDPLQVDRSKVKLDSKA
jgi:hypothetical protein